jgi:pyruvate/2-oxoglutarate dehydrogenase complex dihydrolipoamide acyltransferase (E2) component
MLGLEGERTMHNKNMQAAIVGHRGIGAATAILALAVSSAVSSQQPESLLVDVGACVDLQSPGERLDCYEEQVARARSRAPAPARDPGAQAPAAAAPTTPPPTAPPAAAARTVPAPAAAPPSAAAPSARREAPAERPARGENAQVEDARIPAGTSSLDGGTVESTISALRETVPNAWMITLANGQVWRQEYPKAYRLAVGQRVRITPERRFGGGHRLTVVGMNGFIQVDHVR